jgi:hypothetical protein
MGLEGIYDTRRYMIFPFSQINLIDFNEVFETSAETLRLSVDETKTFVKWDGDTPQCISLLTNTEGPYTHEEILVILSTPEWTEPFEEEII